MQRLLLASAASLFAIGAMPVTLAHAQTTPPGQDSTKPSSGVNAAAPPAPDSATATAAPQGDASTTTGPKKGANSFTEGQAQGRIADAGYTSVNGLKKDPDGIWRGSAMKNGQQVSVWLDYTGKVGQS